MAQRPIAESSRPTAGTTTPDGGSLDLLPPAREARPGGPGSLWHAFGIAVTGLLLCLLLVAGGCLVSLAWESSVLLAVGCLVALLVAAGAGVTFLMTRPQHGSRHR